MLEVAILRLVINYVCLFDILIKIPFPCKGINALNMSDELMSD